MVVTLPYSKADKSSLKVLNHETSTDWQGPLEDDIRTAVVALWEDPLIPMELPRQLRHQVPDSAL